MALAPPDAPLTDGVIELRPIDDRDLPTIEAAASDPEIARRFALERLSPREYLDAYVGALRAGAGTAFAISDPGPGAASVGQVLVELRDAGVRTSATGSSLRRAVADGLRGRCGSSRSGR